MTRGALLVTRGALRRHGGESKNRDTHQRASSADPEASSWGPSYMVKREHGDACSSRSMNPVIVADLQAPPNIPRLEAKNPLIRDNFYVSLTYSGLSYFSCIGGPS